MECQHSVQVHGMCALCGLNLIGVHSDVKTVPITHDASGLEVSLDEAQRIDQNTSIRLRKSKKLSLILDLDQTVLHATVDPQVSQWLSTNEAKDIHSFQLSDSPMKYYIKLRPFTFKFLQKVDELFEMHIYTMGSREYAEAVAKVLDPKKNLFGDRILSRDESGSFHVKSLERLFPSDHSMVVIVDDRADVWSWSENLLKVRPYHFFTGIGDINAPPNDSQNLVGSLIMEKHAAETDIELEIIGQKLVEIHSKFYKSTDNASVQQIIPTLKRRVLENCNITFSSVIPLGMVPEHHEYWKLATSFGATCYHDLADQVTHVIAAKKGTIKVNTAKLMSGVYIVSLNWLLDSIGNWSRQKEMPYLLEDYVEPRETEIFNKLGVEDLDDADKELEEFLEESEDDLDQLVQQELDMLQPQKKQKTL